MLLAEKKHLKLYYIQQIVRLQQFTYEQTVLQKFHIVRFPFVENSEKQ